MATRKLTPRKAAGPPAGVKDLIRDVYLDVQSVSDYLIYGTATIEDRAIVGTYDGVKPVMRRLLFAMYKLGLTHRANTVKAAKIVGDTMGNYHPHGDASIFQAAVAATQLPQPLIDGKDSNWGTMTSGSGAMRYINGRLTKYSDMVFFDPFYLPMMEYTANYDGSYREPVNLNTLLPNGLLNGNFGICPGVNTRTPAFTLPSMVAVLKKMIALKGECPPALCLELEWISDYGGKLAKTAANKAAVKEFFKTGVASVDWKSSYVLDDAANTLRFNRFAPFSTNDKAAAGKKSPLEMLLHRVEQTPGVASIDDDSEGDDPFRQAYIVRFQKTCKGAARDAAIKKLDALFSARQRYDVKVTDRMLIDPKNDEMKISLRPITIPTLLKEWLAYRIKLEKGACEYWIKERVKEIAYLQLMRLAISKLDFIFACVKDKKLDDAALVKKISAGLKITPEQTNQILGRNLRQLRHLEDQALIAKIKALEAERASYEARRTKPAAYINKHLDQMVLALTKD